MTYDLGLPSTRVEDDIGAAPRVAAARVERRELGAQVAERLVVGHGIAAAHAEATRDRSESPEEVRQVLDLGIRRLRSPSGQAEVVARDRRRAAGDGACAMGLLASTAAGAGGIQGARDHSPAATMSAATSAGVLRTRKPLFGLKEAQAACGPSVDSKSSWKVTAVKSVLITSKIVAFFATRSIP